MGATALEQRFAALEKANHHRLSPVGVRLSLQPLGRSGGMREAARILLEEPERVASQRVHAFLGAIPGVGESRVRRLLTVDGRWPIWPLKRVRELTDRQRHMLAETLRREAER